MPPKKNKKGESNNQKAGKHSLPVPSTEDSSDMQEKGQYYVSSIYGFLTDDDSTGEIQAPKQHKPTNQTRVSRTHPAQEQPESDSDDGEWQTKEGVKAKRTRAKKEAEQKLQEEKRQAREERRRQNQDRNVKAYAAFTNQSYTPRTDAIRPQHSAVQLESFHGGQYFQHLFCCPLIGNTDILFVLRSLL